MPALDETLHGSGITYGYRAGRPVLSDVDARLHAGTVTALTGPSGTGKSTLLYLLAGMLTPWNGAVSHHGVNLATYDDTERSRLRARRCGFVFQDVSLDPRRTVLDAVLEPCLYAGLRKSAFRSRALELLATVGVSPQVRSLPGEISGGQAQRVGVCRALILLPDIVFADEPTGNLDDHSADVILETLTNAAKGGTTVVIATHDERVLRRCTDQIALG